MEKNAPDTRTEVMKAILVDITEADLQAGVRSAAKQNPKADGKNLISEIYYNALRTLTCLHENMMDSIRWGAPQVLVMKWTLTNPDCHNSLLGIAAPIAQQEPPKPTADSLTGVAEIVYRSCKRSGLDVVLSKGYSETTKIWYSYMHIQLASS